MSSRVIRPVAMAPRIAARARMRLPRAVVLTVIIAVVLLMLGAAWDLSIGAQAMSPKDALAALFGPADTLQHQIMLTLRLPRVVLALIVGAALAVAGVVMQGSVANPLAAPDIVGVSAGAALVTVIGVTFFAGMSGTSLVMLSIAGSAVAAGVVLAVANAGQGRSSPVRVALAGVTVTAMLLSLTQALLLLHQNGTAGVFLWLVGGVNDASWADIVTAAPWLLAGTVLSLALAVRLNIIALGDDTASGIGVNVTRTRLLAVLAVVLLAGASVAVAGPVAFVGLIVPHIVRRLVGYNHLVVIPVSILLGAATLVLADVGSRYVQFPFETPTGIITALIGAPFFIYLARKVRKRP
ncbi:FecCD family ABC transporter permease [bacterium RCC_150]